MTTSLLLAQTPIFLVSIYSDGRDRGLLVGYDNYLVITYGGGKYELSYKDAPLQSKIVLATTNDETKLIHKVELAVKQKLNK